MEYRGKTFAFAVGLTAGIMNLLLGLMALMGTLLLRNFVDSGIVVTGGVLYFVLTAVSFSGGCACRSHRIAGGTLMVGSALPLLAIGALMMLMRVLPAELLGSVYGAAPDADALRATLGIGMLLVLLALASGAAGVVCLAAHVQPDQTPLTVDRVPADVPVEAYSFVQQYTASAKQSRDDGPSA